MQNLKEGSNEKVEERRFEFQKAMEERRMALEEQRQKTEEERMKNEHEYRKAALEGEKLRNELLLKVLDVLGKK